jgi:hypothetical protein
MKPGEVYRLEYDEPDGNRISPSAIFSRSRAANAEDQLARCSRCGIGDGGE